MKYKIGQTVDAQGFTVEIWHTDQMGQNIDLVACYMRNMLYLLERGWTMTPLDLASNAHRAIWVEQDKKVMGGVIYEYMSANRQGFIVFIFVDEEFRGRRLYSILQSALEDEVIRLGGTSIASMAHKDNESRLKAGAREGMLPQFYRLYKDLTPNLDDRKKAISQKYGLDWKTLNKDEWIYRGSYVRK